MWYFSPYSDFNCRRQGRIDGALCIPRWNSDQQPDFLREIYATAQSTLENVQRGWHKVDESLRTAWSRAVLSKHKLQADLAQAVEREEQAQRYYEDIHGKRVVIPEARLRKFGYAIVVGLVLICEFPLNAIVFQQLGASYVETLLMTGAVAAALVACAHLLGEQLHKPAHGRPLVVVWRIVLALLPFLVIWAVARLRELHMQRLGIAHVDAGELLAINIVINLLIFAALTYFSHRVHEPGLEEVLKAARKRMLIERGLHATEQAESRFRISREKARDRARRKAATITAEMRRRAAHYRREHLRQRTDRDQAGNSAMPLWFEPEYEPKLETTDLDKDLDWGIESPVKAPAEDHLPARQLPPPSAALTGANRNGMLQ